jgi:hypothetical protein
VAEKIGLLLSALKKMTIENNRSVGENSPDLWSML